jgi:hypothetical protein
LFTGPIILLMVVPALQTLLLGGRDLAPPPKIAAPANE